MALIRYTPYRLAHLQQQLNRMFDQFDTEFVTQTEEPGGAIYAPPVDVKEDANAYVVHVEVPGVAHEQLDIVLQENVLTIRGEKRQHEQQEAGQYRRLERSYGKFARTLTLPHQVDADRVVANLENGVLEIVLPKRADARPRQIAIGHTTHAS